MLITANDFVDEAMIYKHCRIPNHTDSMFTNDLHHIVLDQFYACLFIFLDTHYLVYHFQVIFR